MARTQNAFTTVRTEGSLLPADFLQRLLAPGSDIEGLRPEDYHLAGRERIDDAASRSWLRLVGAWSAFRDQLQRLSSDDAATTITREKWLYVLFSELGYGRLEAAKGVVAESKSYPVSHMWRDVPLHLVGANIDLDKRTRGAVGAATMSPHGLVQELLNRSDEYLWGVVSNGRVLRVLRDNAAMTRQAFVEFDLEAMLEGQEYHDFVLLWMLLHESRLEAERPEECWLEKWVATSRAQGTRALDSLRGGVEAAITALGTGLVSHRNNTVLRAALRDGTLDKYDLYRQVLRVVYRLIFLFAAEDRDLLFVSDASRDAKDRYLRYYSASRLRRLAERRRGDGHSDLWQQLMLTFRLFATGEGERELGVPFYGGLFRDADPLLASADISNIHLLEAVRALATVTDGKGRRRVDYRNMGAEELGSVYESLLEQHPSLNVETGSFDLAAGEGSERRTTGSYYTPSSLISLLLDSALEPVLDERLEKARKEKRDLEESILDLRVCDPACGSGHFLIAAAHRLARELAKVRTGDDEPSPAAQRHALRDVVSRCVYGVDLNPMAVELAKVGLWLEAIEPGKPLTFLDHHIKQGNSLLGTTPALLDCGIPDAAFDPIEGDDRKVASSFKARNRAARGGQMDLLAAEEPAEYGSKLAERLAEIDVMPDETPAELALKERLFREYSGSSDYASARAIADSYCAAFVWPAVVGASTPITQGVFEGLRDGSRPLGAESLGIVGSLAQTYEWFHWHLEFPDVFLPAPALATTTAGWAGGFDCVVGNPPWEQIELEEKEFFAARNPRIAEARNASERKRLIADLENEDPRLLAEYERERRRLSGVVHFVRSAGRFPLTATGRPNTYKLFAELMRSLVADSGRVGCVLPTSIATDDTTKAFSRSVLESGSLVSLYDFENKRGIFPAVGSVFHFCLMTLAGGERREAVADFAFNLLDPSQLLDGSRNYRLSAAEVARVNPLSRTAPMFSCRHDAEVALRLYDAADPMNADPEAPGGTWRIRLRQGLFNMASDSGQFKSLEQLLEEGFARESNRLIREDERWMPVYEAKLFAQYDHRFGTFDGIPLGKRFGVKAAPQRVTVEQHRDPAFEPLPRYWVLESAVRQRLQDVPSREWLIAWRDVTRGQASARSLIASYLPIAGVGHTAPLVFCAQAPALAASLMAMLNSFVVDYAARFKLAGAHLTFGILNQLPVLSPTRVAESAEKGFGADWFARRVLELVYTSDEMSPLALDLGHDGAPFSWDEARRFDVRCEIDAALFVLYGVSRDDVGYIMDTFGIVRADEVNRFGEYRTKRRILELFDEYASAGSAS